MKTPKLRCWDTELNEWNTSWIIQPDAVYKNYKDLLDGKNTDKLEFDRHTGLTDKNGVEIAEGDIVKILYTDWPSQMLNHEGRYALSTDEYMDSISQVGKVEMKDDRWMINFGEGKYGDDDYGTFRYGPHGRITVIGNLRDNPELVK